jgi:uncharacterized protein YbaR (Trm112 family)
MAEDKKEYNNQEFLEQLKALNDEDKISMDELNVLDVGNCPICYEKLQFLKYDEKEEKIKPNPNVVTTQCGHSFCFTCLSKHLALKHKCPMCRTKIINRNRYRLLTTEEGCFVINQKVDVHLTYKFDNLFTASEHMQDPNILLSNVKYCMYDTMQAFRRLQVVDDSDEEDI